jgi:hypothetical protein
MSLFVIQDLFLFVTVANDEASGNLVDHTITKMEEVGSIPWLNYVELIDIIDNYDTGVYH